MPGSGPGRGNSSISARGGAPKCPNNSIQHQCHQSEKMSSQTNKAIKTSPRDQRDAEADRASADEAPTRARLTDRDRQLTAVLAVARYLSNEQLAKLFFPERN